MLVRRCYSYRRKSKAFARRKRKESTIQEDVGIELLPSHQHTMINRSDMASGRKVTNDKDSEQAEKTPIPPLSIETTTQLRHANEETTEEKGSSLIARAEEKVPAAASDN